MKSKGENIIKDILILAGVILLCYSVVWLVDKGLNGTVKNWFYSKFYVLDEPLKGNKIGYIDGSWSQIKQFFINIFFTVVIILFLCMLFSAYLYNRYKSRKDITFLADSINSFMKSDDLTLPNKYSEIETQLIRLKAISQNQQQLLQTEMQRKNDLITYLAHDLKTPLASVVGYLSLLDEAPDMPTEQKTKYTGIALNKAYRLEDLINEFFEITRFNLQSIVLSKGKIKLLFMLQQMSDEFYPMLSPHGNRVQINVPDNLTILGDADKLARVFNNILKNAIAYSYENSVIEISAVQQDGNAVITFINQGNPIPPQRLDTIFEKFYRLDSARSSNTGGAGLGLAIAKEIVAAHGGTITAESNPEHTIFTVRLPS